VKKPYHKRLKPLFSGSGIIEFHGTLAELEQAVGMQIEREGQVLRVVPLEPHPQGLDSLPQLQSEKRRPKFVRQR
jgi:hypothetical protein